MDVNETRLHEIFFDALSAIVPDLKPEQIEVAQRSFKPDPFDEMMALQGQLLLGKTAEIASGVVTGVRFKGFELNNEAATRLHAILMAETGIHCSYNNAFMDLHQTSQRVLEMLDADKFKAAVQGSIPAPANA